MSYTPVVFATDDGYSMPTAVAIRSLLKHYSGKCITIFILYKNELSMLSKALIEEAINIESSKCDLQFIDIEDKMDSAVSHIKHISSVTYYRILLPELLMNYDQCLYLDGDIIVNQDIKTLLDIRLESDEYLAGVLTVMIQTASKKVQEQRKRLLEIADFNDYINAGVSLMNLKAMRDNNCISMMKNMISKNYPLQDQDILNVISYKKTKILPPKFNVMPSLLRNDRAVHLVYDEIEIKEAQSDPVIIHYADKRKPWKYTNLPLGEKWRATYREMFGKMELGYDKYNLSEKAREFFLKIKRRLKNRVLDINFNK